MHSTDKKFLLMDGRINFHRMLHATVRRRFCTSGLDCSGLLEINQQDKFANWRNMRSLFGST